MNKISLWCREGTADKVYQIEIVKTIGGFLVVFAYGRRGSTLNTGTKTPEPVELSRAEYIMGKLIQEKLAKGYKATEEGSVAISGHIAVTTDAASRPEEKKDSGIYPQLLNEIDETEAAALIRDGDWCLQEKLDGQRRLIRKIGSRVVGINRKGQFVELTEGIADELRAVPCDFILDGEIIGETLHVFDCLELRGDDIRHRPLRQRVIALRDTISGTQHVNVVRTHTTPTGKAEAFRSHKEANREGVVFKRLDSPYVAGRPNSGGNALKCKFVSTLSAIAGDRRDNGKESVSLWLFNREGDRVTCGNVTLKPKLAVKTGDVLEIRYLYAFHESGVLFQPRIECKRDDIDPIECTTKQLKFKAEEEAV